MAATTVSAGPTVHLDRTGATRPRGIRKITTMYIAAKTESVCRIGIALDHALSSIPGKMKTEENADVTK